MTLPDTCRDCLESSNSSQLHDDAFTSAPSPITWYCAHGDDLRRIDNEDVRDSRCPLEAPKKPAPSHRTDILLHSGNFFDFLAPDASTITIEDIAQGLANESRFNGQTREFYSVAQHSIMVSRLVPPQHALAGLLHDCSESVLKDIPKPLKRLLPDYQALESRVEKALLAKFGLTLPLDPQIKAADQVMLATEKRDLMHNHAYEEHAGVDALPDVIIPMAPAVAKRAFLDRYSELVGVAQ